MTHLRLETIVGNAVRTTSGSLSVPSGVSALCLNLQGTLLVRVSGQPRIVIIPKRSLTFIRGGTKLVLQAAKGEHETKILLWSGGITPFLDAWLSERATQEGVRSVACKPIDPGFQGSVERFDAALMGSPEVREPLLISVVYEVVTRLAAGGDQVQLAPLPAELPETIRDLVAQVRESPTGGWPLRGAADAAGYSPFHFSRVFKQHVGYGFHEYVDRCRTECAVDMLCTSDSPVDVVASTCGFGTPQGLRESVKDYLGLVPSELRAVPEQVDRDS
jgi:AraC-like DNA-binding protein